MNVDGITFESMKTLSYHMKSKNCGEDVSDCVDRFLIKEVKGKFCDIENKSKIQEEVIKKKYDILMTPSESVSLSFLENKGQNSNLANCILKDQIIESSSLKGNKNSDKEEVSPKSVKMYGTDQNIKSSNGGKENV